MAESIAEDLLRPYAVDFFPKQTKPTRRTKSRHNRHSPMATPVMFLHRLKSVPPWLLVAAARGTGFSLC